MERAFGMAPEHRKGDRGGGQENRTAARLAREAPQAHQEERKAGRGRSHAPADPEHDVGRKPPGHGAGERGHDVEREVPKEQERAEERQKERERAGERPGQRYRQPESQPRRWMEDAGLGPRKKRAAGEHVTIPERNAPVSDGVPHRRAPGKIRERQVREDGVSRRADSRFGGHALPGVEREIQIRGPVETAEEHRLPGEDQRQHREDDSGSRRNGSDEPRGDPQDERGRGRIRQPQRQSLNSQRCSPRGFYR